MKLNYIKNSLVVLFLATLIVGCQNSDPDDIFGEKPNVRIEKAKIELDNTILDSEYGWKMMYFTDNSLLGGFSHVMKFSAGNKVTMVSDFDTSTVTEKVSDYELPLGSTLSLLFATPNHIHELGKSDKFPITKLRGKGYLGDNQFLLVGYEDNKVLLKGNRGFKEVTLEKATAEDWVNINNNRSLMTLLSSKRTILIQEGTEATTYNFKYASSTRWASVLNDEKTESVNNNGGIGIGFKKDAIVVSPAIELADGTLISEFVLKNGVFIASSGVNTIIIM